MLAQIDNLPILKKSIISFLIVAVSLSIFAGAFPKKEAKAAFSTVLLQGVDIVVENIWEVIKIAYQKVQESWAAMSAAIDGWFQEHTLAKEAKDALWQGIRRKILNALANAIINWVAGNEGSANFITDWKGFLFDVVAQETKDMINAQIESLQSCFNFDLNLGLSTNLFGYQRSYAVQCPWEPFVLQNFYSDFREGGWDSWKTLISPEGNAFGQFMQRSDIITLEQAAIYDAQKSKLTANEGYKGTSKTPGVFVSEAVKKAGMWEWDYILSQEEFTDFLVAVTDAFVMRIFREGIGGMETDTYTYQEPDENYGAISAPDQSYITSQTEIENAKGVKNRLSALESEYQKLLSEQNQNLTLMQGIRTMQDQILATSTCQTATAYIGPEMQTIQTKIADANAQIGKIAQTSAALDGLISATTALKTARDSGNQSAKDSASANYNSARQNALSSLSLFLGNNQADIMTAYTSINSLMIEVVRESGDYISARGIEEADSGLHGRLTREKQALTICKMQTTAAF